MIAVLDGLYETSIAGGWVLFPIFLVGTFAFYILGLTLWQLHRDLYRRDYSELFENVRKSLSKNDFTKAKLLLKQSRGQVTDDLRFALDAKIYDETGFRNLLIEKMGSSYHNLEKGLHLVSVFAAVAPLLGLLGTVTGMVHTFEVITVFGNSNPVLMASGISEALITTQSGLIIAFPLVLFRQRFADRIEWLRTQSELGATIFINELYGRNQ